MKGIEYFEDELEASEEEFRGLALTSIGGCSIIAVVITIVFFLLFWF